MAHSLEQVTIALRSWSEKNVSEKKMKLKISFSVCPLGCSQHSKYETPIYAYYIYIYVIYPTLFSVYTTHPDEDFTIKLIPTKKKNIQWTLHMAYVDIQISKYVYIYIYIDTCAQPHTATQQWAPSQGHGVIHAAKSNWTSCTKCTWDPCFLRGLMV